MTRAKAVLPVARRRAPGVAVSHLGILGTALLGGLVAVWLGAPMPFLLGGIAGTGLFVWRADAAGIGPVKMHKSIRAAAVTGLGAMIGASVSPDLLSILPSFWISGLAVLPFVMIAHAGGFAIQRYIGGYRAVDAYFAAMPGGLIEAVLLGEKAGADPRILTIQHFLRLITVVVTVPLLFLVTTGEVVGSAAGETLARDGSGWADLVVIALIAAGGLWLGTMLRMPAAQMLGPLCLAAGLSISGVVDVAVPAWLLPLAQLLIGASLGAQFSGISGPMLRRGLSMGALSVAYMLALGLGFALVLASLVPAEVPAMFIAFAAGGLSEMSLIALSLGLSPVIVALHHLVRIFFAIWIGSRLFETVFRERFQEGGPRRKT